MRRHLEQDDLVSDLLKRCRFPSDRSQLDCAVSGGADSVALLVLALATGCRVCAYHVDHGLREGSAREADLVESMAHQLGAGFGALACHVDAGPDLEARARTARHAALPPGVLFGHTMDDQAETVLLRLMRGTGPVGAAGMTMDQHPLLQIRRSETEALCEHLGISVFEDPSNSDSRFLRNRTRHELLPLMADIAQRDVVPLLARFAGQSARQSAVIDQLAGTIDPSDARSLSAAPQVVAASAIRRWWAEETGSPYPPDAGAIERILDVATGGSKACDVTGGWSVKRTGGVLRLERRPGRIGGSDSRSDIHGGQAHGGEAPTQD